MSFVSPSAAARCSPSPSAPDASAPSRSWPWLLPRLKEDANDVRADAACPKPGGSEARMAVVSTPDVASLVPAVGVIPGHVSATVTGAVRADSTHLLLRLAVDQRGASVGVVSTCARSRKKKKFNSQEAQDASCLAAPPHQMGPVKQAQSQPRLAQTRKRRGMGGGGDCDWTVHPRKRHSPRHP